MPDSPRNLDESGPDRREIAGEVPPMTSQEFLRHLRRLGVEIRTKDGKLLVAAPAGTVTAVMQEELRRYKAELLELLLAQDASEEELCSPLTFAQQRLWLIDRFAPETATYNIPQSWTIENAVDVEAFQRALDRLVERHRALRTRFEVRDGEPVQVVMKRGKIPLKFTDLTGEMDVVDKEGLVRKSLAREGRVSFALDHAPLIRFHIYRLEPSRFVIAFDVHHIVADQWSLDILKRELVALYAEATSGVDAGLAAIALQYSDVAERERSEAASLRLALPLEYWRERLKGAPPLLELPFSKMRPAVQSYEGLTLRVNLDSLLTRELRQLAARSQTSLYLLMLAAFVTVLYRYTGENDLCVGTPITGRKLREEEALVGLFVNLLPLRCTVDPMESFEQLLRRMSETVPADFEHGNIPFQKLVTELHPHRSHSYSPLFQVMFALNPKGTTADDEQEETFIGISKFDLTVQITERAETLDVFFEYRTDLFARTDMEQFSKHFRRILQSIVKNPKATVCEVEVLTAEDVAAFRTWNATWLEFDRGVTLVDLLEAQAKVHPDTIALYCGEVSYSFGELHQRANYLAALLRANGAGPGCFVAICLDRSELLIVSMLAVLKTGAAYLPLDPKYPEQRLAYMLADSRTRLLIAQRDALSAKLSADCPELTILFADEMLSAFVGATNVDRDALSARATPEDAAYLIYTSGSTGKPKGVVIEHRNAVALIEWAKICFGPELARGILASTSVCFDLSIFEIFWPLSAGGTIILVKDVLELPRSLHAEKVTLVNTVPSAMSALLEAGLPSSVNTVSMAGEILPTELVDRVYATGVERVFDLYGPTETTTYSTYGLRVRGAEATIGKPIGNTQIYLLDDNLRQVPPGALGEIFIGGEGVTRGYLDRPELTDERFLFLPQVGTEGRLYRTGDMSRQMQDGSLVYLGRRDQQIKLRGHRIEIGEVEAALREVSGISMVAVVLQKRGESDALVAYVGEEGVGTAACAGYRDELKRRLPAYMLPALIVPMDKMPLTPNGKIDRKTLGSMREPDAARGGAHHGEAPNDFLEQWMANVWAHRLGIAQVARDDHFFDDLGGHSLVAFEIFAEIEARLGIAMMLATLFQAPTVKLMAAAILRQGWKDSGRIAFVARELMPVVANRVIYLIGPEASKTIETVQLAGERVMAVGSLTPGMTSEDVEMWAGEIVSFEATRPALVLVSSLAESDQCRRLGSCLTRAGFASVSVRTI
jgi:amino acid adenylation domain-containing protein